jgi:hypothetical protein
VLSGWSKYRTFHGLDTHRPNFPRLPNLGKFTTYKRVPLEPKSINHRRILGLFCTLTLSKPTGLPSWCGSSRASLPGRKLSAQPTCTIVLCNDSLWWGYLVGYSLLVKFIRNYFTMLDTCLDIIVKYMECCNPSLTMIVEQMCNTSWQCSNICLSNMMNFLVLIYGIFFALTLGNCDPSTVWVIVVRSLGIQEMSALQNHNLLL